MPTYSEMLVTQPCGHSLCFSCGLGYAHLCLGVPFEQREWVKAYRQSSDPGPGSRDLVRYVTACDWYKPSYQMVGLSRLLNPWERPWPDPSIQKSSN